MNPLLEVLVCQGSTCRRCLNPNFADYLIPSSMDAPAIEPLLVEKPWSQGPFGSKGVGEPALIPVAAAVANAVSFACGHILQLPLSRERVLLTLIRRFSTGLEAPTPLGSRLCRRWVTWLGSAATG